MKHSILGFIFIFIAFFSFAQNSGEDICAQNKIARYKSVLNFNNDKYDTKSSFSYDVKYYRLNLTINPAVRAISGDVSIHFESKIDNFQSITFDLNNNGLFIDSIMFHEEKITDFTFADYELTIGFPVGISNGILDSVSIYYHGVPEDNGFGSFDQTSHDGAPIIWTLSEPYGARDWWPCKQSLNDKADSIDVFITNPTGFRAASNGILVSETTLDESVTAHWKHRHPITAYLVAFAVTNYAVYSDFVTIISGDEVEVLNYVFPEDLTYSQANTPNVLDVIQLYSELFIPYPYKDEKYGHAQFVWGGGMEHQTMSFMINFGHSLMAHELAHQWFGDYITCGSWQDIWLNEGFATYLDGLTNEHNLNDDGVNFNSWKLTKINQITQYPSGSVFCYDTTDVNRIFNGRLSYSKGALVLHMIRKKIGDDHFFTALQNYLNDPELANGHALTSDFRYHLENVSGIPMTEFFNDWIYGEGYPIYNIFFTQNSQMQVDVTINQSQSHTSVGFFEMDVPVIFYGVSEDTLIVFNNVESGENFNFSLDFQVTSAKFDPYHDVISRNSSVLEIDTFDDRNRFYILPNPASDRITVTFLEKILPEKVIISDNFGKQVLEFDQYKNSLYSFEFNISDLPIGMYIITFYKEGESVSKKFIKS
jgi:aminopeptidase N